MVPQAGPCGFRTPRVSFPDARFLYSLGALAVPAFSKAGRVELGVCGSADDFVKADKWGFDYYEPCAAAIAAMSDTGVRRLSRPTPGIAPPLPQLQ